MSSLERKAIKALRDIKETLNNIPVDSYITIDDNIIKKCDEVLNEYDARRKRLGEKENLSKDSK